MPMNERPRTAHYICADEICVACHDDAGDLVHLYYSPSDYAKRQNLYGTLTYPQPASLDPY